MNFYYFVVQPIGLQRIEPADNEEAARELVARRLTKQERDQATVIQCVGEVSDQWQQA